MDNETKSKLIRMMTMNMVDSIDACVKSLVKVYDVSDEEAEEIMDEVIKRVGRE